MRVYGYSYVTGLGVEWVKREGQESKWVGLLPCQLRESSGPPTGHLTWAHVEGSDGCEGWREGGRSRSLI